MDFEGFSIKEQINLICSLTLLYIYIYVCVCIHTHTHTHAEGIRILEKTDWEGSR